MLKTKPQLYSNKCAFLCLYVLLVIYNKQPIDGDT